MKTFLYNFFHNETNDRTEKGLVNVPADKDLWPKSWTTIVYKRYLFFKEVPLPHVDGFLFKEILFKRRSSKGYISSNELMLPKLSYILQCGYGLQGGSKEEHREENRTVPSGGKRYPLEIYVFLFKQVDGCTSGIYHYSVKTHALEPIMFMRFSPDDIASFSSMEWLQDANGMICITSVFGRTVNKYGSRGYRYILLEAGHTAQNMLLAGTEKSINIIPIGGVNEAVMEKMLGLNISSERVVYVLSL